MVLQRGSTPLLEEGFIFLTSQVQERKKESPLAAGLTCILPAVPCLIILVQVEVVRQIHGLRLRSLVLLTLVRVHFCLIKLPLEKIQVTKNEEDVENI